MASPDAAMGFGTARWLVRRLLSEVAGAAVASSPATAPAAAPPPAAPSPEEWRFVDGVNGKPEVAVDSPGAELGLRFNVAHTGGFVVVAVSADASVGVDAESSAREVDVERLVQRYFASAEREWLSTLDAPTRRRRFFDVWVLKEAIIKMRAGALGSDIGSVVVLPGAGPVNLRPSCADAVALRRWQVGDVVLAAAVDAPAADVVAGPVRLGVRLP